MKFKSALITQASGSVGGLTFSRNRGGMYCRGKAMPVNPNTAFQNAIRTIFQGLSTAWNGELSAIERDAWDVYAENTVFTDRLGETIKLTGQSCFCQCNTPRIQAGMARIDAAPIIFTQPSLPALTLIATASDQKLSVAFDDPDGWKTEVGSALLVYASRPMSLSRNFFAGPYRYAGKIAGAVQAPTSPTLLDLPFVGAVGQRIGAHIRLVRADGRISMPFRATTDVAAGA